MHIINKHYTKLSQRCFVISFELIDFPKGILIGRRICGINWGYFSHIIQNYELIFLYQGEACFTIDGKFTKATMGDCIFLKPNQVFNAKTNPKNLCRYYILHFILNCKVEKIPIDKAVTQINQSIKSYDYKEMSDVFKMPQIKFKIIYLLQKYSLGKNKDKFFDILEKLITERNHLNLSSEIMISSYLCEILIMLSRLTFESLKIDIFFSHRNQVPRNIQEAIFFIHDNYKKQICLKDISELLNISNQSLIKIFKKYLHRTPLRWINLFRVSKAKELLKYTSLSIKEITYEVGFENPYYFCRFFKKIENMTPSEFRNIIYKLDCTPPTRRI